MATKTTTAVDAGIMPDNMLAGGLLHRTGSYEVATTALAADDVIQMVPIPKGAMIVDIHVWVVSATSHGSFDVGDAGDVDRFFDGLSGHMAAGSAVDYNATQHADGSCAGVNYTYTADDTIDVTWLQSGCAIGTRIVLGVIYTMTGTIEDESS